MDLQPAELVNILVLSTGVICAVCFVVWLATSGRWRNPLAGLQTTGDGPGVIDIALVILLYVAIGFTLMRFVPADARDAKAGLDSRTAPGSPEWSLLQNADSLAKLVAAGAALIALRLRPSFPARTSLAGWRVALAGLLAALVLVPVCESQRRAVIVTWQWLHPAWEPALHPVLIALKAGTLSNWDKAALFVGATLAAPIAEETFFRGLLLQALWRYTGHAWLSIVLSAIAFGMVHSSPDQLALWTMGVILGYVRLRTRSLSACMLAHALFNANTMIAALLFPELIGGS